MSERFETKRCIKALYKYSFSFLSFPFLYARTEMIGIGDGDKKLSEVGSPMETHSHDMFLLDTVTHV